MEPRQEPPARTLRQAAFALVALVGLLVLVAIGSSGHARAALGGRRPSYVVVDTIVSLVLVLLVLGVVASLYVVVSQREYLAAQRRARQPRGKLIAAGIALLLVLVGLYLRGTVLNHHHRRLPSVALPAPPVAPPKATANDYQPRFATAPVLLVLGIGASAALATYLAHRSRRHALGTRESETSLALTLADVLDDTLDDLRAEPDPRRAVIAAYARLERTLAAFGLPREASEAPDEYLHRILVDLEVGSRSARRLTQLFARAKFSQHDVDPAMKEEAIHLLETIRADLREADERSLAGRQPSGTAAW